LPTGAVALVQATAAEELELFDEIDADVQLSCDHSCAGLGMIASGERLPRAYVAAVDRSHPARRANRALVVANVMHEFADDDDPSVGLERRGAIRAVRVGCLNQSHRSDLFQVGSVAFGSPEFSRAAFAEVHVCGYHGVAVRPRAIAQVASDRFFAFLHFDTLPINEYSGT
jgi:hypothetical protein